MWFAVQPTLECTLGFDTYPGVFYLVDHAEELTCKAIPLTGV